MKLHVTLRQLEYVEALALHGSFSAAAVACGVSRPAMSMIIKGVEEALGTVLFERGAKARPTAIGIEVVYRAQAILRAMADLQDVTRASIDSPRSLFRLGIIPTVAPYVLHAILQLLAANHPELRTNVRETITGVLLDDLSFGRLDAVLVTLPVEEPAFDSVDIYKERLVLVRPTIERDLPAPAPKSLALTKLLLLEDGDCIRDQTLALLNKPRGAASDGASLATLVQMVAAGHGSTLIPQMAIASATAGLDVDVVRFQGPEPERRLGLVWRSSSPLSSRFKIIAADLARACRGTAPIKADQPALA